MKILALIVGVANAQSANSYMIYNNQAACLTRSQAMCAAMHCDGTYTKYWWACLGPLWGGTVGPNVVISGQSYTMQIHPSGLYGQTTSNAVSGGLQGLNVTEQSKVVTAGAVAPVFPTPFGQP